MLVDPVKHYFYIWLIHVVGEGQVVDEPKRTVLPQSCHYLFTAESRSGKSCVTILSQT